MSSVVTPFGGCVPYFLSASFLAKSKSVAVSFWASLRFVQISVEATAASVAWDVIGVSLRSRFSGIAGASLVGRSSGAGTRLVGRSSP